MLKITNKYFPVTIPIPKQKDLDFYLECGRKGYLEIIKLFKTSLETARFNFDSFTPVNVNQWERSLYEGAIEGGHLSILLWIVDRRLNDNEIYRNLYNKSLWKAHSPTNEHFDIICWAIAMEYPLNYDELAKVATMEGNLVQLKILLLGCVEAMKRGGISFHYITFLKNEVCSSAAFRGHIHILEWMFEKEYLSNSSTIMLRAVKGKQY